MPQPGTAYHLVKNFWWYARPRVSASRSDRQWTDDLLKGGTQRLSRWREAVAMPRGPSGMAVLAGVRERLAADLDTPGALLLVDAWADAALGGEGSDAGAPALVASTVDALLGVQLTSA